MELKLKKGQFSLLFNKNYQFSISTIDYQPFDQMFRHRKRLISKRLSMLMKKKNQKYMKELFAKFIQSRSQQINGHTTQQQQQEEEPIQEEEIISEDQIQQEEEGTAEMSLNDYVASLSPREKQMFKQENPELPETFFMSKKEKQKYFSKKNSKYQNSLKHTPERQSKNQKRVQFKEKYVYKPFNQFEKVAEVKKAKQFNSPYNTKIHFS